jgi:hypothetical protein
MPAAPAPQPAGTPALDAAPLGELDGISPAQFASQMGLHAKTIERRIAAGLFPVIMIGGRKRLPGPWIRALFAAALASGCVVAEQHGAKWIADHAPTGGTS